jgi:sec-independent protein translocase protein TatA
MGSIGSGEILLIIVLALILFGPQKLPELGKALAKAIKEFKKAEVEIKEVFKDNLNLDEKKELPSTKMKGEDLQNKESSDK